MILKCDFGDPQFYPKISLEPLKVSCRKIRLEGKTNKQKQMIEKKFVNVFYWSIIALKWCVSFCFIT